MKLPESKVYKYFETHSKFAQYNLCSSNNHDHSLKELQGVADEESLMLWNDLRLQSTTVQGHPLLRKEITKLYQNVGEKGVLTFPGAEEGIFCALNLLISPGDHVIIPSPSYQSLHSLPKELGADISFFPLKERDGGWSFNYQEFEKLIRPNTRLVIINFPHNPTGAHIDRMTLEDIVAACRKVGAYLFSDEVYRFSEHREGASSLPPVADLYEKGISLGTLSKTLGMPGLKIGWLSTQEGDLLQELTNFKTYLATNNSGPSEILGLITLRAKDTILARNMNIIRSNIYLLDQFFQKYPKVFAWRKPSAGPIAFPKLLHSTPIQEFCIDLGTKEGVLLLPGSVYDQKGNYFRIGFGRKDLPEVLNRFERYVKNRFQVSDEY